MLMYQFQIALAAYWNWLDIKVDHNPKRWQVSLTAAGIVITFLPFLFGVWALIFYPIGWITVLPGLFIADKKQRRIQQVKSDQLAKALQTKKLMQQGKKSNKSSR
ncbi:hypothetical protein [Shimia sp.]|uniref:hypothetical protein n=1 Tax=Shimia sp. TaxID=1954381 RepID=UPI003B8D0FAD